MKRTYRDGLTLLAGMWLLTATAAAQFAIGSAFTYQGRLQQDGQPLNGAVDLLFTLWDSQADGSSVGFPVQLSNVPVVNGLFTVTLNESGDFGPAFGFDAFNGTPRYLEIGVRQPSIGPVEGKFTALAPRHSLLPTPYALALPAMHTRASFFADETPQVVGGYSGNVTELFAFGTAIGGGGELGLPNKTTDHFGTVGGGLGNLAGDDGGAAGDAPWATVGGGVLNEARAPAATVSGGDSNTASGSHSYVGGGYTNEAGGRSAVVPGGEFNRAAGDLSFAAGESADAAHAGAFVWSDTSGAGLTSTAENQFSVRAAGGVRIFSATDETAGVVLAPGGGAWSTLSDCQAKENFEPVAVQDVLQRVVALPLYTWNYRAQADAIRHLGVTAQDFHQAFCLGEDERRIATVDVDGVALAAIQALHQQLSARDAEIEQLKNRLERLEAALAAMAK